MCVCQRERERVRTNVCVCQREREMGGVKKEKREKKKQKGRRKREIRKKEKKKMRRKNFFLMKGLPLFPIPHCDEVCVALHNKQMVRETQFKRERKRRKFTIYILFMEPF